MSRSNPTELRTILYEAAQERGNPAPMNYALLDDFRRTLPSIRAYERLRDIRSMRSHAGRMRAIRELAASVKG